MTFKVKQEGVYIMAEKRPNRQQPINPNLRNRPVKAQEGTRQSQQLKQPKQPQQPKTKNSDTEKAMHQLFSNPVTCMVVSGIIVALPFALFATMWVVAQIAKYVGKGFTAIANVGMMLVNSTANNLAGITICVILIAVGLWLMFTARWAIKRKMDAQQRYEDEILQKALQDDEFLAAAEDEIRRRHGY